MGQAPTASVNGVEGIEQTRQRLEDEFAELETYLSPAAALGKRTLAIAGGVLAALAVVGFVLRKRAEGAETRRLRSIDERLKRLEEMLERSTRRPAR